MCSRECEASLHRGVCVREEGEEDIKLWPSWMLARHMIVCGGGIVV